ncbi:MAG: hypothetical protein Q8P44_04980 [Dehalococcoidia bacterium]|nr:hypothetical protein [Dehalococcoidia bacterium]
MTNPNMQVTILINSANPWCESDCAINWSKGEEQTAAISRAKQRFGDDVLLEFIDVADNPDLPRVILLARGTATREMPFSTLMINGETRISGPFDTRMLMDMIETEQDREL